VLNGQAFGAWSPGIPPARLTLGAPMRAAGYGTNAQGTLFATPWARSVITRAGHPTRGIARWAGVLGLYEADTGWT